MRRSVFLVVAILSLGGLSWLFLSQFGSPDESLQPGLVEATQGSRPVARSAADDADSGATSAGPTLAGRNEVGAMADQRGGLEIVVRDEGGRPIAEALVAVFADVTLLEKGRTDAEGRCSFAGRPGRASCAVAATGRPWSRSDIGLTGQEIVILPEGAVLAGQARVAGGLPWRELRLSARQGGRDVMDLPESVRRIFWTSIRGEGETEVVVGPDGAFSFRGLESDQKVHLEVSQGFSFASEDRRWRRSETIDRPRLDVLLELVAMPRVIGRVVDAATGEGLPRKLVAVSSRLTDDSGASISDYCDDDGTFIIGVNALDFVDLTIQVEHGGRKVTKHFEGPFRDTLHVGDILLEPLRPWSFVVVDREGMPIPKAIAVVGGAGASQVTDEKGQGHFEGLSATLGEAQVGAFGFRTRSIPIVAEGASRQRIELARSNSIVIRITGLPAGVKAAHVEISGALALRPESFSDDVLFRSRELSSAGVSDGDERFSITLTAEPDGRFHFTELGAGVPFTVKAYDDQWQLIGERDDPGIAEQEQKSVELAFDDTALRVVDLLLVDDEGRPVVDASISSYADASDGVYPDDAGRIVLLRPRIAGDRLLIRAEGFEDLEFSPDAIEAGAQRLVLRRRPN